MKTLTLLMLACIPFSILRAEKVSVAQPDPALVNAVEEAALKPLAAQQVQVRAFSRVRLMPPSLAWGPNIGGHYQAFTIVQDRQESVLGLVHQTEHTVLLLDPASLRYVPAGEHPLLAAKRIAE
jgi:hypothetical protein